MARISTYTIDSSIDGTEFILGREADGTTKQFSMSALQTFLATSESSSTSFGAGSFSGLLAAAGNATVGGTIGVTGLSTLASVDIGGGNIDGTIIGASSAAVATITDLTITGDLNLGASTPGTSGQYLRSAGDGAVPTWDTASLNDLSDVLIADNSIYIGHDPTATDSTAQYNVAVSVTALDAITTGDKNIAIGHNALTAATTSTGNVAIGYLAGQEITTTSGRSTLVGFQAGTAITTGDGSTAVGYSALQTNTTGLYSTAIGAEALKSLNSSGGNTPSNNTAVGFKAGTTATYGSKGTYIGSQAGEAVTIASDNTFIGALAGTATTTGNQNTAVGSGALDTNITGSDNTAVGFEALFTATGSGNVAIGSAAGKLTDTGDSNVFIGNSAAMSNTSGGSNVAVGFRAIRVNTVGSNNVAIGGSTLSTNVDGSKAVAIGSSALTNQDPASPSDTYNVAIGYESGKLISTGTQNTLLGSLAGDDLTTGGKNLGLGYNVSFSSNAAENQIVIGNQAAGHGDNIIVLGNTNVTSIEPGVNTATLGSSSYPFQDLFLGRQMTLSHMQANSNNQDLTISQFDGSEVARVHDGSATRPTGMTGIGYGFGFKMPVLSVDANSSDTTVTLTAAESGSIIQCDADTNNVIFNLPVIDAANKAGLTYTFVNTTAVDSGHEVIINTSGTDGNDKFLMYGFNGATSIRTVTGDTLKIPNSAAIGTVVRITCLASGASNAAEIWLAEVFGESAVTNS